MKTKTHSAIIAVIGVLCSLLTASAFAEAKSVTLSCSGYTGTTTLTTFQALGDDFKRENRASWNKLDVIGSALVIGLVIAAYAYFWTWLD